MTASASTPWGKMPLDLSSRGVSALPAAPVADSHMAAGAAFSIASHMSLEGDLTDLPPFDRSGRNRFSQNREREPGRREAPLGLLPMPHAPP